MIGIWFGARAETSPPTQTWFLRPEKVGVAPNGLRLPERAFYMQTSRGWQLLNVPLAKSRGRATLAAGDGLFWNLELRALVNRGTGAMPVVGLIFRYENPGHYAALLWNTRTGALTLRTLRDNGSRYLAGGKAAFGKRPWASIVLRAVMGDVTCYVNGAKVLTANEPSLLGRAAVFVTGGEAVPLDGLEVRALDSQEADADLFGRSRTVFETKCATCHALDGPWNSSFGPDDWESVVNGMLSSEGASRFISRTEADRIIDYLRIISLHPDRRHYRPSGAQEEPDPDR